MALGHALHDLRLYKSRAELRVMRKSAAIAAAAHLRAMRAARPGSTEAAVEAELLHAFRSDHAVPAYEPIVGGGANACVLHYRANNAPLRDGDLLLVDAGAEFECYASDITRTCPVNGRWSVGAARALRGGARGPARRRSTRSAPAAPGARRTTPRCAPSRAA